MLRALPWIALALAGALAPATALAHIEITSHVTRHGKFEQKVGPCGAADDGSPGSMIYTYEPGEVVTIAWDEFIDHPAYYRIAFDPDGSDDFVDPASADERYSNDAVLLDGIEDLPGVHDYSVDLTLPAIECEACTIQVIQVMLDKAPFGDGNDIYYHCIDVRLVVGGGPDINTDEEGGCGCDVADPRAGDGLLGALLLGLVARGRRRRGA
ncbi:MAG: hypothetical protein H6710_02335 [Myxococcales bacterium]|nr:hypothetical protein [Myxococcales bacterium]